MTNLFDPFLDRRFVIRPELRWYEHNSGKQKRWVVQDPLTGEYFYCSDLERQLSLALDGTSKLRDILDRSLFSNLKLEQLIEFVKRADGACLLTSNVSGRTPEKVIDEYRRRRAIVGRAFFSQLLSIRIPLFDPSRVLDWLHPVARIVYSKPVAIAAFCLIIVAFSSAVGFILRAPTDLQSTLLDITPTRLVGTVFLFAVAMTLHELGHALACSRFQAKCKEIGLMLLVFSPCLYCDTTDAWKLPSRLHRAVIAAGGVYVELVLASVAALVWICSDPTSALHFWSANLMLICSFSTLLVNGNPLLRYDGYYVLSDLWGVPNLHEQSRLAFRSVVLGWLSGKSLNASRWSASPIQLAAFGLMSWMYRQFVFLLILWFLWKISERLGAPLLGLGFMTIAVATWLASFMKGLKQFSSDIMLLQNRRYSRILVVGIAFAILIWFVFFVEFGSHVTSRARSDFASKTPIYANYSGTLESFTALGSSVSQGEVIARLSSTELELKLMEAKFEAELLREKISHLRLLRVDDEDLSYELARRLEEQKEVDEAVRLLEREFEKLDCVSTATGKLLEVAPVAIQPLAESVADRLLSPVLSEVNSGRFVERGEMIAWIVDPSQVQVVAYLRERDSRLISVETPVTCRWDCDPQQVYTGFVKRVSPEPLREIPAGILADLSIPLKRSITGELEPTERYFRVEIGVENYPVTNRRDSLVTAYFHTHPKTLAEEVLDALRQQIRLSLYDTQ